MDDSNAPQSRFRIALPVVLLSGLIALGAARFSPPTGSPGDESRAADAAVVLPAVAMAQPVTPRARPTGELPNWLDYVPAEAQMYVEFRGLTRIRSQFRSLGIWETIQSLSDRTATAESQATWQEDARQVLGMTRDQAVSRVLGRRCAVIAADPTMWKQGLILAELTSARAVDDLLKQWNAVPSKQETPLPQYRLRARRGVRVARRGNLILIGPIDDTTGLWQPTINLLAGNPTASMSADPDVNRLIKRLPGEMDGLLVINQPHLVAAESKESDDARPRRSTIVGGVRFTPVGMELELRGGRDLPAGDDAPRPCDPIVTCLVPETIACWSGRFDPVSVLTASDDTSVLATVWNLLLGARRIVGDEILDLTSLSRIGPSVVMALSVEPDRAPDDYAAPVMTVITEAREAPKVARDIERLATLLALYANTQLARAGAQSQPLKVEHEDANGQTLYWLEIGKGLAVHSACPYLADIELAWIQTDQLLIVSTSRRSALRHAQLATHPSNADPLSAGTNRELSRLSFGAPARHWTYLRGAHLADMLGTWVDFAKSVDDRMLRRAWWAERARDRARAAERFGVTLRGVSEMAAAEVLEIERDSPAFEKLQVGDRITSVDSQNLDRDQPAHSVAQKFRERRHDDRIVFGVIRNEAELNVAIPLSRPPTSVFNPMAAIRPLIAMGRRVSYLTVVIYDDENIAAARVVVHWARPEAASRPALP